MLTITDTRADRNCQGYARREFLKIGTFGFGAGLTLSSLLAARALGAAGKPVVRDRSVVFLFLQGGPSHIETFDPKMSAPVEFRSIFGEVATRLPGVTFGSHFPKLAAMASRLTVVRSYGSGNYDHTYRAAAGGDNPLRATMGALYARVAGANHPVTGMPSHTLVLPEAVEPGLTLPKNFETNALPTLTDPGDLGPNYAAFNPIGGGTLKENMELRLPRDRFEDRRLLLTGLDRIQRQSDSAGLLDGVDKYQQQAFDVILGGVADAFDLAQEDPATLRRYDTSRLFRNDDVQKWYDMRRASNLLGRQMLLARRLCEAGCGFVTVSDCGWDMHSNSNSPKNLGGMEWLGPQVDHAVSAFLEDVEQRGLSDRILLVVTGEMGRTPRINRNGGRDHYGSLTPLVFAGGGLPHGRVIGQSDSQATQPAGPAYRPRHLVSTVMHALFDISELRVTRGVPSELVRFIEESEPITDA